MRLISTLIITFGMNGAASAHSLDSEHGWTEQLAHQVFGMHHLALTVLMIGAGLVALSICYRKASGRDNK